MAPLETVGNFLRDVGATIQRLIRDKYSSSSRCLSNTSALSIHRVRPPSPPVSSESQPSAEEDDFDGWELSLQSSTTTEIQKVYAQTVLLSTGGRQDIPSLGNSSAGTDKIVSSDKLISLNGFREVGGRLYKHIHTSGSTLLWHINILFRNSFLWGIDMTSYILVSRCAEFLESSYHRGLSLGVLSCVDDAQSTAAATRSLQCRQSYPDMQDQ